MQTGRYRRLAVRAGADCSAGRNLRLGFIATTVVFTVLGSSILTSPVVGATPRAQAEVAFDLPAGPASETLQLFASQSGEQIVYLVDAVRDQKTRPVFGHLAATEALQQMLQGTDLVVRRDPNSRALAVVRRSAKASRASGDPVTAATAQISRSEQDEWVELSAFTVSAHSVDRYRADTAISAVRIRAPLLETASSVSVITRGVIDDLSPTRLFDVTRYLAGIEDGRGIQFSDRQIIRGFESNGRTVDNFLQIGADNYDEAVVERIEVSKGPNAILAPAGVPGGSINVITKSPTFTRRHTVSGLVGLFDAQKVTVDLAGPIPQQPELAYRVIAAVQDSRRYWDHDARLRNSIVAPMLTWRFNERTQLTVKGIVADHWVFREPAYILDAAVTADTEAPFLAPGFSSKGLNGIQPWSHVGVRTADLSGLFTWELTSATRLRIAANARRYREDSTQEFLRTPTLMNRYHPSTGEFTQDYIWSVDPSMGTFAATHSPFFDPTSIPVRGDRQDTTHHFATLQADLATSHSFGAVSSQTVVGGAFSRSSQSSQGWSGDLPSINLLAPATRSYPAWAAVPYYDNRIHTTNWQAYVNQRLGFINDRMLLTAGITHNHVHNRNQNRVTSPGPSILDGSRDLWLASVLVKPRDTWSLYYVYSTNSTPTIVNEAPLWRDGQQHEVGIKTEWFDRRLAASVAWFDITQTNVSVPNPERQTDMNAPEQLLSDLGDHGLEIEVMGALTRDLSIIASHTELRLRDSLGRRVRGVADRNSALLLNYRFDLGGRNSAALHVGVTHAGERPGDTTPVNFTPLGVPTRQSFFIPSYTLLNAGAAYTWRNTVFRLNVDNLLDRSGYLQQAGGRVSGTGLSTAPGINVKFTTSVEF